MTKEARVLMTELEKCAKAARAQGWRGEWMPTADDCESCADAVERSIGRKPTRAEWTECGWPQVGGAHVA